MNQPHNICDPSRIESCLMDSFNDEELAAFEAHLEVCPACRQALEERAAAPSDWQEARDLLSSDAEVPLDASGNGSSLSATSDLAENTENNQQEVVDGVLGILSPTDDPRMLGRLGGYEIAGVVGRGGFGVVLKALDPALNRYVAIKVLAPQLATSGAARQRFAREARAAASVVHENVVAIHAVADSGPLPYFVMPYLRGASLQKRLDANGPFTASQILRIAAQIAAGLSAAHAQGLVHRDIKPANVMLEDGVERLQITDFGLARAADDASLTRTGVIAGTPQFMSPEQARGEPIDFRSDLFSLGSVMYAMCTGFPPFRGETSYGTLSRICATQPQPIRQVNPDIPQWLVAIIEKLHAKKPEDRFQSAHQVADLLQQCLAHLRQPDAAPLPATVVDLVNQSVPTPMRRAARPSLISPRHLRRAASDFFSDRWHLAQIAIGLIAAYVAVTLYVHPKPQPAPAAPAPSFTIQTVPIIVSQQRTVPLWNDEVSRDLSQLQTDVSQLENRIFRQENSSSEAKP